MSWNLSCFLEFSVFVQVLKVVWFDFSEKLVNSSFRHYVYSYTVMDRSKSEINEASHYIFSEFLESI